VHGDTGTWGIQTRGSEAQRLGGSGSTASGLGWSGIKYGSPGSGKGAGPNLYLVLNTRTRDLMAETRDLRMFSGLRFPFD
jgi:hypothetical protein